MLWTQAGERTEDVVGVMLLVRELYRMYKVRRKKMDKSANKPTLAVVAILAAGRSISWPPDVMNLTSDSVL